MSQFTNNDIKLVLSGLRSKIRNGQVTVSYRDNGALALKSAVARAFELTTVDGYAGNFNPQTLRRFEVLFDIPFNQTKGFPSQDDTATALQNFINRRSDPWSHVRRKPTTEELQAAAMLAV